MRCFSHPDADAIAVCKHCAKGLCAACAVEGEAGITCGNTCAEHVKLSHEILLRSKNILGTQARILRASIHLLVICGVVMGGYGLLSASEFPMIMGCVFILTGVLGYWIARGSKNLADCRDR